jgi:hypothetical protein
MITTISFIYGAQTDCQFVHWPLLQDVFTHDDWDYV